MSKSKGNVVSPRDYRRALRRGHRALLHPLHRAARRGRRLEDEGIERRAPLPLAPVDARPRRLRERATSSRTASRPPLLRKAHWAIDKVTRDLRERFAFNTAIAAVMELVNDLYRERDRRRPSHVRFAVATAGSLIFPFAPHLGAEVYELMTGGRVWEEPWPAGRPGAAGQRRDPARRAAQRQADRPHRGARRGLARTSSRRSRAARTGWPPGWTARRSSRRRRARQARELRGR